MSQRGGSVTSFVRWGRIVYSPLVGAGEVDVFLAFEKAEALRNLNQLRPGALALINLAAIEPVTVTSGGQTYPDDARLHQKISQVTQKAVFVDGEAIASGLGNIRAANVVLLGALSALMERAGLTGTELSADGWLDVITGRVPPKFVELNRQAFNLGRQAVTGSG
jgi:indolepyruvate ferredoxin oxidoreductase beta subunit